MPAQGDRLPGLAPQGVQEVGGAVHLVVRVSGIAVAVAGELPGIVVGVDDRPRRFVATCRNVDFFDAPAGGIVGESDLVALGVGHRETAAMGWGMAGSLNFEF